MATTTRKKAAPAKKAAPRKRAAEPRGVSDAQKQAMQQGRTESAAIRKYLDALKAEIGPKRRGRRRSPDQIRERIVVIDNLIADGAKDALTEVKLRQERLKLMDDLQDNEPKVNSADFEEAFVKAVKPYSERQGLSYDAWRDFGVPVIVLRKAGMTR